MRWNGLLWLLAPLILATSSHQATTLNRRELTAMASDDVAKLIAITDPLKNVDPSNPASHLSKILIPRAPDTDNNTFVREYIVSTLKKLNWHVELDEFTDKTPIGLKRFANIIATQDINAPRRVVLSAHYDSKYYPRYPENQFVGATDSAAPCAMMLDLAETLNPLFTTRQERLEKGDEDDEDVADTTLQLIFFDGEEAFVDWTDTDSIYGARHLAEKWENSYLAPNKNFRTWDRQMTELGQIEHLILLDLLGAPQPTIRSYFVDTAWLFDSLISAERRLGDSGAFVYDEHTQMAPGKWTSYFLPRTSTKQNYGYMGDDHVPFLRRGVSILHLITEPFPHVWHTLKDDASALDLPTLRRWNIMLRVFISEYLNLKPQDFDSGFKNTIHRSETELVR
ncbi:hypothetical protein HYPSUDRAFT_35382 [Hypholoma sublateritium FD-334 SS-4]|uniref:Peptide hydrolase n=1 Tax=Hypholoma sublateritium (strain FD-334 SS-4) TaxID=945553 RepID=A0A0D2MU00_HYPSF|nr:hypothetical protein HYPSUDRAFT_35382 [Hypholoma sublateritium FD-334 SS-4]